MKILLVDDDPSVLQTFLAILKRNPIHDITVGTNGPLAIENAQSAGGVDLLITDVVMEPTDGFTLRQQLQALYPAMKVIFVSGYDLSDYAAHTVGCDVLTKPVDADTFLAAVAKIEAIVPTTKPKPRVLATPKVAVAQPSATPVVAALPTATPVATQPTATPVVAQPAATPVAVKATVAPVAAQPAATPVAVKATATPVAAQPAATPVAVKATATPVVAQPAATPVAVKATAAPVVAQPAATPVAVKATATPAAAQPTATPVASTPTAATPVVAQPAAVPVVAKAAAAPVAVKPTAAPVVAKAAPVAAQPKATPVTAKPTAAPVAAAKPATPVVARVVQPAATPVAVPPPEIDEEIFGSDELLNKRVGNYNIVWKIGEDEWGPVYVAVQTSMARPVAMKVLSEEVQRNDATAKQRFIAMARAKAAVKHASILSVYEAGEASGHTYYTYEYVDGMQLAEAKEQGRVLTDALTLRIIKTVAEGVAYLQQHKIAYAPMEARRIYIGKDDAPHLANIAALAGEPEQPAPEGIAALSTILTGLLPDGTAKDPGLQAMLAKMLLQENGGFISWAQLQIAAKALEPKVIPADAIKLTAQEEAAIRAVEAAKQQQKKTLVFTTIGVCSLLLMAAGLIYWKFIWSNERSFNEMIAIPAGEFIYQNGKKASTDAFWIDKHEVTVGQYARFLSYLESNPTTEFDHPNQPKGKKHIPKDDYTWKTYYGRARVGKPAAHVPIDLNCPIFNVDYWDAYAYAKWAGKRLPTEKEWEKAARGTKGFTYPWGNEFDPKKVNSGEDYEMIPGPKSDPKVDGYVWWSPVDAIAGDVSPFGVVGMGGNVAEWAETDDTRKPIVRGASFKTKKMPVTNRVDKIIPEQFFEFVGFRCASDQPPK